MSSRPCVLASPTKSWQDSPTKKTPPGNKDCAELVRREPTMKKRAQGAEGKQRLLAKNRPHHHGEQNPTSVIDRDGRGPSWEVFLRETSKDLYSWQELGKLYNNFNFILNFTHLSGAGFCLMFCALCPLVPDVIHEFGAKNLEQGVFCTVCSLAGTAQASNVQT